VLRRRATALVVVLGLALLPGPSAVAPEASARLPGQGTGAAAPDSSLRLDPPQGPPGSVIRVTPVTVTSPDQCVALFDDQEVARFTCGTNSDGVVLSTEVTVPETAPGTHTIRVCQPECSIEPAFEMSAPFTVLTVVPDLGGLTLAEARDRLRQARLVLGAVEGPPADPAARVTGQDPPPGSAVGRRGKVDVTVSVPDPLLTVPDLRGRTRAEAAALLEPLKLVLVVRSGSGRVRSQRPAAGDQVPPGSVVEVTLRAVAPPVLVTVPDLRRRTLTDAEATVAAAGLALRASGARDGTVATQTPAPGTRAPRGSLVAVTMTAAAPVPPPPRPWLPVAVAVAVVLVLLALAAAAAPVPPPPRPWLPVAVAVVLVLLALAAAAARRRGLRSRRSRRWVRQHVRVVAATGLGGGVAAEVDEIGQGTSRSVGLEPHPDRGSQILEEVRR
jgi:hypothetical protein